MTRASNLPEPIQEPHFAPRTPQQSDPDRLISVYLRTLTAPQTIKTYNTELRMFLSYLEGEIGKGLEELTAEDLSLYREHLIKTYASATAAKKLAALRRFLIFTYMAGATAVNPEALRFFAKSPRVRQDPSYNVLTEDELSRMLSAARTTNYRDYVLLAIMAGCGLREAEVVDIRIGDFQDVGRGEILLRVRGKGDKVRNVSALTRALAARPALRPPHQTLLQLPPRRPQACLLSRVGKDKTLTTRSVRNVVKKYVRAAGITKAISPHSIRHTVGTNMAYERSPSPRHSTVPRPLGSQDNHALHPPCRGMAARAYQYNTLPI